ncbi:MAG: hypothetical protein O2971_09285 [Proteobacteria bacterium]|nr:hypothetical protein [Pseudomonadota bacterium]
MLTPKMFANAIVRKGLKPDLLNKPITLSFDEVDLEWYKGRGREF